MGDHPISSNEITRSETWWPSRPVSDFLASARTGQESCRPGGSSERVIDSRPNDRCNSNVRRSSPDLVSRFFRLIAYSCRPRFFLCIKPGSGSRLKGKGHNQISRAEQFECVAEEQPQVDDLRADLARRIDSFSDNMSYTDRGLLDKLKTRVQEVHEELLLGVMEGKKKE